MDRDFGFGVYWCIVWIEVLVYTGVYWCIVWIEVLVLVYTGV